MRLRQNSIITNLDTTDALTAVKDEIPDVSDLVKKSRLWCKKTEIEKNILALLSITNSWIEDLMQR